MSRRMLLSPSVVRIVRSGLDALNPPSLTPEHCVVDSSWASTQRLVANIKVAATTLETPVDVAWTMQSVAPMVMMVQRKTGTAIQQMCLPFAFVVEYGGFNHFQVARSQRHAMKYIEKDGTQLYQRFGNDPDSVIWNWGAKDNDEYDFFLLVLAP